MSRICLSSYPANHHYHHSPAPDFTWAPIKRTCTSSHPHHPNLHKHQHQSTSWSSLVQTPLDSLLNSLPWHCSVVRYTNLLCLPRPQSSSSRIHPPVPVQDSPRLSPSTISWNWKDTIDLICSSPVEVSSYPLLPCLLLFIWLLSINVTN